MCLQLFEKFTPIFDRNATAIHNEEIRRLPLARKPFNVSREVNKWRTL
jgi:hypothetical protein